MVPVRNISNENSSNNYVFEGSLLVSSTALFASDPRPPTPDPETRNPEINLKRSPIYRSTFSSIISSKNTSKEYSLRLSTHLCRMMAFRSSFLLSCVLSLTRIQFSSSETLVSLPPSMECNPDTEYFDISWLKCNVCDQTENYKPNLYSIDAFGNANSCTCAHGYKKVSDCTPEEEEEGECAGFSCVQCEAGKTVSRDGFQVSSN